MLVRAPISCTLTFSHPTLSTRTCFGLLPSGDNRSPAPSSTGILRWGLPRADGVAPSESSVSGEGQVRPVHLVHPRQSPAGIVGIAAG